MWHRAPANALEFIRLLGGKQIGHCPLLFAQHVDGKTPAPAEYLQTGGAMINADRNQGRIRRHGSE